MEMFARQHFDVLLREAASNFAERCVYRCGGPDQALSTLAQDPAALEVSAFVDAVFAENLLADTAGACFVLEALERRQAPGDEGGPVAEVLARQARAVFADVLLVQTAQVLQQNQIYS